MDILILYLDTYFIQFYRMTDIPLADYFIGTFILALLSVVVGEATVLILKRVNGSHMEGLDRTLSEKHELSMQASRHENKPLYRQLNCEANEAFGKVFFNLFTFSAASLWSVFFALAWMQSRFNNVELAMPFQMPVVGDSAGYVFVFLLFYILSRILIKNLIRINITNWRIAIKRWARFAG